MRIKILPFLRCTLLTGAGLVVALSAGISCRSSHRDMQQELAGTWILYEQGGRRLDISEYQVISFEDNGHMTFALRDKNTTNYESQWVEFKRGNSYQLKKRQMDLRFLYPGATVVTLTADINRLDADTLIQTVFRKHIGRIDQMALHGPYQNKFYRADEQLPSPLGSWGMIDIDGMPFEGIGFRFYEDGRYEFLQQTDNIWESQAGDHTSYWVRYGDLLCTNYFNELFSGQISYQEVCTCYRYRIDGDQLTLYSDQNGYHTVYHLLRIEP